MVDEPVRGRVPDPSFWSLSGIDRARAYLRGVVPRSPLSHLIGFRLTQVGAGSATLTVPASPWLQLGGGIVDVRVLLEEALGLAVLSGAPPGHEVRTAALSINQLRLSGVDTDAFVARARTLNSGSTFTLAEVQAEDGLGRAVAHATGSFLIRPVDPSPPLWTGGSQAIPEPVYPTPDPPARPFVPETSSQLQYGDDGGVEAVRRLAGGEHPALPFLRVIGGRALDVDEGVVVSSLTATEWLCSRSRELAPSVLATLACYTLTAAAVTLAPAGHSVGTVEQSVTLVRSVPPDGRNLLGRGTVVHHAGELVISTVEISDADGYRVALGYETAVIQKRRTKPPGADPDRFLATVLFTDIVKSTQRASELGDARWKELLEQHHAVVRKQLQVFQGREVKTTGDGFLATFDSPGRGVQAARGIRNAIRRLGIEVRAGLHTGECELTGTDVAGIAVHIAARVQALAGDGEVLVTSTVRDLVTGSGLRFVDRGAHQLKGIEGVWHLFALAD